MKGEDWTKVLAATQSAVPPGLHCKAFCSNEKEKLKVVPATISPAAGLALVKSHVKRESLPACPTPIVYALLATCGLVVPPSPIASPAISLEVGAHQ